MLCIKNTSHEPYFNMAAEEYLFKNFSDDIFMLWRNDNAVIVGKHQNTLAEINTEFVKEKNIKVVRRLSGGGAVFHDLGNLNFTFIMTSDEEKLVDFKKYTKPIIDVLARMGIQAQFEGRNDLTIDGKKFSGNAEHVIRNRILHHGTILFSSEIKDLTGALKANPLKFKDKAVKSVRSRVTNISEHLQEPLQIDEFTDMIMDHVVGMYTDSKYYEFNGQDVKAIQTLADEKYSTWEWNYGYQAKYNFENLIHTSGGNIEFHMDIHEGIITKCRIFGDYFNTRPTHVIEEALIGVRHEGTAVKNALSQYVLDDYFSKVSIDEFIAGMF